MSTRRDQETLDAIAEEFALAIREGKNPSIDDYAQRHGDPSGELKTLLASVAMIEGLKSSSGPRSQNTMSSLQQLDDYQIVRETGRGGMGVVFEAIHQSLGRRVAIKVLSYSLLDQPKHLARFRREARAAARLQHPNIVSVFGVGQSDDQHYFVMDYIRGVSLRQWLQSQMDGKTLELPTDSISLSHSDSADTNIDLQSDATTTDSIDSQQTTPNQREITYAAKIGQSIPTDSNSPSYFRWVAKIGATITDALDYAHGQGVLHRDIKPANLLLDQKGTIWIADFGLAKLTEQDATMTTDVVGTPQYMAPESFESQYDAASETYCVGLTLYELITQRPAIEGKGTSDTIRKAIEGVTVSPRKLNPNIPRDLETIILKSTSVDPANRYAQAADFRDDLQRFLDDRPISARRTGPVERLYRWVRREPMIASLTTGIFASLVALAAVATAAYWKTNSALTDTQVAYQAAESSSELAIQQRELAQSNLQTAINAFDDISQKIVQRGSEPDAELLGDITESVSPNVTDDDAAILQSLLVFFDELAENNGDNDQLKRQAAAARKRAGDIYIRLGQLSKADESFQASIAIYQGISNSDSSHELITTQAQLLNDRALIAGLRGRIENAIQLHEQTIDLLQASDEAIASAEGRFEYARANSLFTQIATRAGLETTPTRKTKYKRPFARQYGRNQPETLVSPNPKQEIDASIEAIDALRSLVDEFPGDRRYEIALARAYRDRANALLRRLTLNRGGITNEQTRRQLISHADRDINESISQLRELYRADPNSPSIKYEFAKSLSTEKPLRMNLNARAKYRDDLFRSFTLSEELLRSSPDTPRYMALKAKALGKLAAFRRDQDNLQSERSLLKQQLAIQADILKSSPGLSQYQIKIAETAEQLANNYAANNERENALNYLDQSIQRLSALADSEVANQKIRQLKVKKGELKRSKKPERSVRNFEG